MVFGARIPSTLVPCHDGSMRVVAGLARGRRLVAPDAPRGGGKIRPTTDRVRESVFNALHSRNSVVGARVLDLFAGTGALGIEALSRGARHATFVDLLGDAVDIVAANLSSCDLVDRATVVRADGLRWLANGINKWDLILLDPPYGFSDWERLLGIVESRIEPSNLSGGGLVVLESEREIPVGPAWHVESNRRIGSTVVMLLRPAPGPG